MIVYILTTLILTIIIFCITTKLNIWIRIFISGIIIVIAVFLFYFLIKNFDAPADGSRFVTREEINSWNHKK